MFFFSFLFFQQFYNIEILGGGAGFYTHKTQDLRIGFKYIRINKYLERWRG